MGLKNVRISEYGEERKKEKSWWPIINTKWEIGDFFLQIGSSNIKRCSHPPSRGEGQLYTIKLNVLLDKGEREK